MRFCLCYYDKEFLTRIWTDSLCFLPFWLMSQNWTWCYDLAWTSRRGRPSPLSPPPYPSCFLRGIVWRQARFAPSLRCTKLPNYWRSPTSLYHTPGIYSGHPDRRSLLCSWSSLGLPCPRSIAWRPAAPAWRVVCRTRRRLSPRDQSWTRCWSACAAGKTCRRPSHQW